MQTKIKKRYGKVGKWSLALVICLLGKGKIEKKKPFYKYLVRGEKKDPKETPPGWMLDGENIVTDWLVIVTHH